MRCMMCKTQLIIPDTEGRDKDFECPHCHSKFGVRFKGGVGEVYFDQAVSRWESQLKELEKQNDRLVVICAVLVLAIVLISYFLLDNTGVGQTVKDLFATVAEFWNSQSR